MKTSCRGAHTAKWILAVLLLPSLAAGRTRLSQARRRTRSDSRHRGGDRRCRRGARLRQLSRTARQLHPPTLHRSGSRLLLRISSRPRGIGAFSVQRKHTICAVQSRLARLLARRQSRFRRRLFEDQRPTQPDHSGRCPELRRTLPSGNSAWPDSRTPRTPPTKCRLRSPSASKKASTANSKAPALASRPPASACALPRPKAPPTSSANTFPNSRGFPPQIFKPIRTPFPLPPPRLRTMTRRKTRPLPVPRCKPP